MMTAKWTHFKLFINKLFYLLPVPLYTSQPSGLLKRRYITLKVQFLHAYSVLKQKLLQVKASLERGAEPKDAFCSLRLLSSLVGEQSLVSTLQIT